jgi:glyoxylase-like metal-dependent hydrolase (beta-lactamase superfamily II)
MELSRVITRRAAIKDMGKAGLAIMVFGTACTSEPGSTTLPGLTTTIPGAETTTSVGVTSTTAASTSTTSPSGQTQWARANLGFVSAYILYRNSEAAIVDTGVGGSEGDIESALGSIGLGWDAVTSVILTHKHPDHVGSVGAVARLATNSNVYVGEDDLAAIGSISSEEGTQGPVPVLNGDNIFGLDVIGTPGHTPGSISLLDSTAGILVVGDAMNTRGGSLASASADPQFTEDLALADESVRKLAGFDFEIVLVGHGEPILTGGSVEVNALADDLGA